MNATTLFKRAFMFLEDGDWTSANDYCEKVLDQNPENAYAYLGKLMAELHVKKRENLKDCEQPFDTSVNYQKTMRFADADLKEELSGYIKNINERNELARKDNIYTRAIKQLQASTTTAACEDAKELFAQISGYRDSDEQICVLSIGLKQQNNKMNIFV